MTSTSFVGTVSNNTVGWDFINDVRLMLRGTGSRLKIFGRNKNRQQYAKNSHQQRQYRCNLPIKYATHYGMYVYGKDANSAKIVFETVKKIYSVNGVKISP